MDPYGSEPGKRRPVLIIQNDIINRSNIRTIICVVITSNINQGKVPGNILLEKSISGLGKTQEELKYALTLIKRRCRGA